GGRGGERLSSALWAGVARQGRAQRRTSAAPGRTATRVWMGGGAGPGGGGRSHGVDLRQAAGGGPAGPGPGFGAGGRAAPECGGAGSAAGAERGDDRPPPGGAAPPAAATRGGDDQAGQPAQEPDPGAHVHTLGRAGARLRGDRPGGALRDDDGGRG